MIDKFVNFLPVFRFATNVEIICEQNNMRTEFFFSLYVIFFRKTRVLKLWCLSLNINSLHFSVLGLRYSLVLLSICRVASARRHRNDLESSCHLLPILPSKIGRHPVSFFPSTQQTNFPA